MAVIPKDPVMLMSFFNTQLRDNYSSFDDLCSAYDLDAENEEKTSAIDYHYDADRKSSLCNKLFFPCFQAVGRAYGPCQAQ